MVLLESIFSNTEGRYAATTETGEEVKIIGVPHPNAVAIYGEQNIDDELEKLRTLARTDDLNYYLIQDSSEIMQGRSNARQAFVIAYVTFIK